MKTIFKLIVILAVIYFGTKYLIKVWDEIKPKTWTLFLYSSPTPDKSYQENVIEGYKSKVECQEKGVSLSKKGGSWECGSNCGEMEKKFGFSGVCDDVCGPAGCRD